MTTNNKPAQTFYQIQNNWDDRLLCKNNMTWVNDGRESTVFETLAEAENVAEIYVAGNQNDTGRIFVVAAVLNDENEGV